MASPDPARRRQIASIAGLTGWDNTIDRSARARLGQNGLLARFEREAREQFPNASDSEIARRVKTKRRLHMARLAQASAKSRRDGAA